MPEGPARDAWTAHVEKLTVRAFWWRSRQPSEWLGIVGGSACYVLLVNLLARRFAPDHFNDAIALAMLGAFIGVFAHAGRRANRAGPRTEADDLDT